MRELASVLYMKIYRVRIREIILLAAERLKSRQTIFPQLTSTSTCERSKVLTRLFK